MKPETASERWTLRSERRTGDLARLLAAHAALAEEMGWDATFEAYVAQPMAATVLTAARRERIWMVESDGRFQGSVAIVQAGADPQVAQLRWFLVAPDARGQGLGKVLLERALAFAREVGYGRVLLWTVQQLEAAAHLYQALGFVKTQEVPGTHWGADVIEEQYTLWLERRGGA